MIAHVCLHIYVLMFPCFEANFRLLRVRMTENKTIQKKEQQKNRKNTHRLLRH